METWVIVHMKYEAKTFLNGKWTKYYWRNTGRWVKALSRAKLFNSEEEALIYGETTPEVDKLDFLTDRLDESDAIWVRQKQLSLKLCRLFKVGDSTPYTILADLCEDKGMATECEMMRRSIPTCESNR